MDDAILLKKIMVLEQKLEKAEHETKSKTAYLNNISHDIRTPMNAIIGFANIALKNNPTPKIQYCLDKIKESSDYLLTLLNSVLDISRIESGNTMLDLKKTDITKVTNSVINISAGFLTDRDIELCISKNEPKNPYVFADELRIREVLINIISNAVKFTDDGGKITFKTDYKNGKNPNEIVICYQISDTGIGMSEEFLHHIFEEFTREDNTSKSHFSGSGLGMAITKHYIDLMGGAISVKSKVGIGTDFYVEIPFEQTEADTELYITSCEENDDPCEINVLLAEDNNLNAEIATSILKDLGMSVTHAENGDKTLELFKNSPENTFDLILMDIIMPMNDGIITTKNIRSLERADSKTIPIIAMTANAFDENIRACVDAGMNGHISKPIDKSNLYKCIQNVLKNRGR